MKRMFTIMFIALTFNALAQWVPTNGPYGGTINCITKKGSNLFAGTMYGILSTSNGGLNWQKKCNGLDDWLTVKSLISNSSIIVAGTDNGIYISDSDGANWVQSNNGLTNLDVTCLIFINQDILLGSSSGVFKSSDFGETWSSSSIGLPNTTINSFIVVDNQIFIASNLGVFKSSDNGFSWSSVNNGLSNTNITSITKVGSTIFVGTYEGLFKSSNYGTNWTTSNGNLITNRIYSLFSDGTSLFAGKTDDVLGDGLFRSENNGITWSLVNNGIVHTPLASQPVDFCYEFDGTDLYIGSMFGVHKSINDGNNWTGIGLGRGNYVNTLYKSDNLVLCGTENGLYITQDEGDNWSIIQDGLPSNIYVTSITEHNSSFFIGSWANGIYYSNDNCNTWHQSNNGLTSLRVMALATYGGILLAGTSYTGANQYGMHISYDNGMSWVQSNEGLPNLGVYDIISSGVVIYIGTNNGLYLSTNNGESWISSNGIPTTHTLSLTAIGSNIFAGQSYGGSSYPSFIGGVFVSNDYGSSWGNNNFPSYKSVYALENIGDTVYAGTDYLYKSSNNGQTWTYFTEGFTDQNVTALAGDENLLYCGKNAYFDLNGVWKYNFNSSNNIIELSTNQITNSLYPNPSYCFITVDLDNVCDYSIYNLTGQEMTKGKCHIGSNLIDIETLTNGVYFIELTNQDSKQILKFIKL